MTYYGTLAGALSYHDARGNSAWAADGVTDGQREEAMTRAAVALDGRFGTRFPGTKVGGRSQERAWPRECAYDAEGDLIDDETVPDEIVNASYEMALAELVTPGSLSPSVTPGKVVTRARVEGAVDVTYAQGMGASGQRPVLTVVNDLLAPLLGPATSTQPLLRV